LNVAIASPDTNQPRLEPVGVKSESR